MMMIMIITNIYQPYHFSKIADNIAQNLFFSLFSFIDHSVTYKVEVPSGGCVVSCLFVLFLINL